MVLKKLWNNLFGTGGALDKHYSKNEQELIALYKKQLDDKRREIEVLQTVNSEKILEKDIELTKAQNDLLRIRRELALAEAKISGMDIPDEFSTIREHYDDKYPKKFIKYKGRKIETKSGDVTPNANVTDYIYDFESLRKWCRGKGLVFENYLAKHKDFGVAMDTIRKDIFDEFVSIKRYRYDKDLFGNVEHWSGPWTSWYLKLSGRRYMDCEDSSLLLMSLFKAAGVPRGFQRVVCGMTKIGGHAAVQLYSFGKEGWLHYETTAVTPVVFSTKSTSKNLAITDVWFSFDWEFSWSMGPATIPNYERDKK